MKKIQVRITSGDRITVPHEICHALGVHSGDQVLFEVSDSEIRVRSVTGESPFEKYRGIGTPGIARGRNAVVRRVHELRGG